MIDYNEEGINEANFARLVRDFSPRQALYFTLDENEQPVPQDDAVTAFQWQEGHPSRHAVGKTEIVWKGLRLVISTVFLTINHNHFNDGPPILWETRVFGLPANDEWQERYSSAAAAREGHKMFVALALTAAVLGPKVRPISARRRSLCQRYGHLTNLRASDGSYGCGRCGHVHGIAAPQWQDPTEGLSRLIYRTEGKNKKRLRVERAREKRSRREMTRWSRAQNQMRQEGQQ